MGQVVTSSSVLTVSELKDHSWKMWNLYKEISEAKKDLEKIEKPKLKKTIIEPSVSYEWAKKESKRRRRRAITSFIFCCLLMFGAIFALFRSDMSYINENNVVRFYAFAGSIAIILLIVCIVICSINNTKAIHVKELKKIRPQRHAVRDKNRQIREENDRIESEWTRNNGALKSKLNSLSAQAAQYSELYSIWNKCADEIRHDHYVYDWEWNIPDNNFTMMNHIILVLGRLEYRCKQPMRIVDIVYETKDLYEKSSEEAHERLKQRGWI